MAFYEVIRYDFVSTGKLIELTCDPKMNNERVARAMCKRLAEKDSTDLDLPPSIALTESTPRLYQDAHFAGKNAAQTDVGESASAATGPPKMIVVRKKDAVK